LKKSIQIYDRNALDEKDKVIIQAGTITDENGDFSLFVKPDTYNLIAYADGMELDYEAVTTYADDVIDDVVFQITGATEIGEIVGEVTINGGDDNEQYATISYRKKVNCPDCEMLEIKSKNVINLSDYQVELPIIGGDTSYQRVASTNGYETETDNLNLNAVDAISQKNNQSTRFSPEVSS
jgi:hypothetical protein